MVVCQGALAGPSPADPGGQPLTGPVQVCLGVCIQGWGGDLEPGFRCGFTLVPLQTACRQAGAGNRESPEGRYA